MTGYRTYRLEGCRIEATPWAVRYMDETTVRFMVAELLIARLEYARVGADGQHGPFVVTLPGEYRGRGATPLDALRFAVDEQQRALRLSMRAVS